MKTCIECNNPVFGGGYCKYHQYKRKMAGGDLFKRKPPKPKKPINKESPKRVKDNRRYRERLEDRWNKSVQDKTNFCFFCGKFIDKREDNHHIRDREVTILDEELWVWVHRLCHSKYHSSTVEQLMREPWYESWMSRLEKKDTTAYFIELNKRQKNIELFD